MMGLEQDAYQLIQELWSTYALPNASVTVILDDDPSLSAALKLKRGGIDFIFGLNPDEIKDGETLYVCVAHEMFHAMNADTLKAFAALELDPNVPPYALHLLKEAEEAFVIRLERMFVDSHPCPAWLKDRTYGGEAA